MKRNARRLCCVLLVLVMSLVGGTILTAQAQGETITVYLDMESADWNRVYIYGWWDGNYEPIGYWPGMLMTHEGGSVYSAEIPADIQYVIFNNGDGDQTADLELPGDGYIYTIAKEEWTVHNGCAHEWSGVYELWKEPTCTETGGQTYECYDCDGWLSYTVKSHGHDWVLHNDCCHEWNNGVCDLCGEGETEEPDWMCDIYFDNTFMQYENVYAEWYSYADGEYYSVEMTHVQGNIYTAQLPSDATMWFSDGEISTLLADVFDDYLFVKDGIWLPYNGCIHEWDDGDMGSGFDCMLGGICQYTCQSCGEFFTEGRAPASHNIVDGVCTECGKAVAGVEGNLYYEISDGQVTIVGCKNNATGKLVIPDTIEEYPVTAIGRAAFYGIELTEVTIPDSVTTIEEQAFTACEKLTKVTLSNRLTTIGDSSFEGCRFLENITIPDSVTDIEDEAFWGCVKLSNVVIPEGVISIGEDAFGACSNLTEVTVPASVTTIGNHPFYECYSLTKIWVAEENAYYSSDAYGVLFDKNKTKLIQAPMAGMQGTYSIPDSVTTIGELAFYMCASLTELTLPDGLTTIEDDAFRFVNMSRVILPDTVTTVGACAFACCQSLKDVYFCGDAPVFGDDVFAYIDFNANVNVYYHEGKQGWPANINHSEGTKLTWKQAHIYGENVFCVVCGESDPTFTGLVELDNGWYYYQNGVQSQITGLVKDDGRWWYVVGGKVATGTTSLVKYNNEWWYVVDGKVEPITTLVKYNNEWWYVVKGKIASNTTSLVKYNGEWWYVVKGKIASKTTTLVKYNNEWWYVVKGKIASKTTTLVKYNGEWWYVVKGKIASKTTTLVQYNGGWYYLVKGKLAAKTTTLVKYNGGWYYVNKGSVDWGYTVSFVFNGGTYRIVKGRVA